jgi:hypothetical protein
MIEGSTKSFSALTSASCAGFTGAFEVFQPVSQIHPGVGDTGGGVKGWQEAQA